MNRQAGFTLIELSQAGFTLIELSIVLAIVGLLVGGGLMAAGPLFEKARLQQTLQNMDQVESAVVLYAIRHERLPCPADGSLRNTQSGYGQEQFSATGACAVSDTRSVLPWVTLGLHEGLSSDGWGRRFAYSAAPALTKADRPLRRQGLSYPGGPDALKVMSPASPSVEITPTDDRAAYVLISHGHDGEFGWTKAGSRMSPTASHPYHEANGNGLQPGFFLQGPENDSKGAARFQDLVRWRTAGFIIQSCGPGACGNP